MYGDSKSPDTIVEFMPMVTDKSQGQQFPKDNTNFPTLH